MDHFDDIPGQALAWHRAGKGAALATVTRTWGSAPRRVGSQLAISGAGEIAGSVSGGCVEGAVVAEAVDAIESGKPVSLEYGVSDGDAFAVGLACGGTICILVEPIGSVMPEELLTDLVAARSARHPVAYVTGPSGQRLERTGFEDRFRLDRSGFAEEGGDFIAIHNPPLRLVIVGAVHIAQALVPMAQIAGYDPIVIDPRESFASEARFPGVTLVHDWPDDAVASLGLDSRTGLVLLTHDPKLDDPALEQALASDVFYIGALGSPRTHEKRLQRLRAKAYTAAQLGRIHGPVGLDIGAANPSEIAAAILAQIIHVLRQGA